MDKVIKNNQKKIGKMKRREENKKIREREKGFTLVEVILVVAIITIISAIAVPQVGKYLNKANRSKVIGAVAELNTHRLLGVLTMEEIRLKIFRIF